MKTKKLSLVLITIATLSLLLAGCFGFGTPQSEKGMVKVQMEIPESLQAELSEQFVSFNPVLTSVTVAITKETTVLTETATISGDTVEIIFPDVPTGSWTIEATIFDETQQPVYASAQTVMVNSGTVTTAPMHMALLTGDLTVDVTLPTDQSVASGNICLMNPADPAANIIQSLQINTTTATATLMNVAPSTYPMYVELLDVTGQQVAYGELVVDVLPGRTTTVTAQASIDSGSLIIDFTWALPPAAPTGVTAVNDGPAVLISWNPNTETDLAGYMVYRSTVNDPGTMTYLTSTLIQNTSWLDTTVTSGVTYYYWVQAYDSMNYSSDLSLVTSVSHEYVQPKIAALYTTSGSNYQEIVTMNLDGSDYQILTQNTNNQVVRWSPDGTKLLFASDREGVYSLYVMNADGTNVTRLTPLTDKEYWGAWSPDGTQVLFHSEQSDGYDDICIINADGTNLVNVTNTPGVSERDPIWSPDGMKILFNSAMLETSELDYELYVMNVDGTNLTQLTFDAKNQYKYHWSPDGTQILVESDGDGIWDHWDFEVMSPDGTNAQVILNHYYDNANPVWSPDGTKIAFGADVNGDGLRHLYTIHPDGTGLTMVYEGNYINTSQWVDNDTLVFENQLNLWSINTDGTNLVQICNTPEYEKSIDLSN